MKHASTFLVRGTDCKNSGIRSVFSAGLGTVVGSIFLLLLSVAPASAFGPFPAGTAIHVDAANTSGVEDGSAANPFNTIREGLDAALAGDVVGVAPGVYAGDLLMKDQVDLLGSGADRTTIDATGGDGWGIRRCASDAILSGFRITNAAGRNRRAVDCREVSGFIIENNEIVDNNTAGIHTLRSVVTIRNNLIRGNIRTCPCTAILSAQSELWIVNNVIEAGVDPIRSGIEAINFFGRDRFTIEFNRISGQINLSGVTFATPQNNTIRNNIIDSGIIFITCSLDTGTIINNTLVDSGISLQGCSEGDSVATIVNNIIAYGRFGIDLFQEVAPVLLNNDVFGNNVNYEGGIEDQTGINGNISADPLFVDSRNQDFHLACGSPAIDAGTDVGAPGIDFEGDPRPTDGTGDGIETTDIGADERTGPSMRPIADAGADEEVVCASASGGSVALDGSGSSTNVGIVLYEWFEDFGLASQKLLGTGEVTEVTLPIGAHVVTLRTTDAATCTDTDDVLKTVTDPDLDDDGVSSCVESPRLFAKVDQIEIAQQSNIHGITSDGTNWHISKMATNTFTNYDSAFQLLGTTSVAGVLAMGGIAFADSTGTIFVIDTSTNIVREVELDGTIVGQFTGNTSRNPIGIAYDPNTDTLWLVYFHGIIENRTLDGILISSFTNNLRWSGIAVDPVSDTLLLLDGSDRLFEYSKVGFQLWLLLDDRDGTPDEQIVGNGLALDYDASSGTLHITTQSNGVAIFRRVSKVIIDIKPGSDLNPINLTSQGGIPVAILGSDTFDVAEVDVATLAFGPAGAAPVHQVGGHLKDVSMDGFTDLVSHYATPETGIVFDDTEACVTGQTFDGTRIEGCDLVTIVPEPVSADTLFGSGWSFSGDPSEHAIVTIDQNDGSITVLEPQAVNFKGVAFDSDGRLFATNCGTSGEFTCSPTNSPSLLMELDPVTGVILNTIGTVTDASGFRPTIETLSVQPGTDVLYGFGGLFSLRGIEMWTIGKSTAMATLVASFGQCSGTPARPSDLQGCGRGYGFAPDGTLYHIASEFRNFLGPWLTTLDPSTGALITSIPLDWPLFNAALAVRRDGTLFSSDFALIPVPNQCRTCPPPDPPFITVIRPLLIIDPLTGAVTEVGGGGGIADLDFRCGHSGPQRGRAPDGCERRRAH